MKTVNKEIRKPVEEMERHEVINQLARHVHPDQYHETIQKDTDTLKELLTWYKNA